MFNIKFIASLSAVALTAFTVQASAQSKEAEVLPYVNSISVTNADMFSGSRGAVTMSVWSGNCTLSIASTATLRDVPNLGRGTMKAIVISVKPVITACSNTRIAMVLTATASLDELVKTATAALPADQRQVGKVVELPMVMPQGLQD